MATQNNAVQSPEQHFPNIPRRLTIQSASALILLLSGVALVFCAMYLPPEGVIDTSVIIVFGQLLIAVGTLVGVDMSFMLKVYLAFLKSKSLPKNEEISKQISDAASQARDASSQPS